MKTTTADELRTNCSKVLKWIANGEQVAVTCRGKVVAKIVPPSDEVPSEVDWSKSAALERAPWSTVLTAEQSAAILAES